MTRLPWVTLFTTLATMAALACRDNHRCICDDTIVEEVGDNEGFGARLSGCDIELEYEIMESARYLVIALSNNPGKVERFNIVNAFHARTLRATWIDDLCRADQNNRENR